MTEPATPRVVSIWTYVVLVVTPIAFSSNLVIGRAAVFSEDPTTLAFWRWSLAVLIVLPFVIRPLRENARALLQAWPLLLLLGFLGMVICGTGVYLSLRHTTATNGTLIYTTSPAFIVAIEMILGRRAFSLRQFVGIVLATLGVAVIVSKGDLASLVGLGLNPGDLGVLAAAVSWAIYSILLRDPRLQALPDRLVFVAIAICGVAALLPLWLVAGAYGAQLIPASGIGWLTVLALALVPSVFAYIGTQWTVRHLGAAVTGMALYFLPVAGVILAAIFLGESVHPYHLAGTLLTIGGVVVFTFRVRRAALP